MGEPYRKRLKRHEVSGHARYVTFSCFQRRPFFPGRVAAEWFLESLADARDRLRFQLWAYVVMPEHVHLLVLPPDGMPLRSILHAIKRPVAGRIINWVEKNAPSFLPKMTCGTGRRHFWQAGGGYDRNLWTSQEIHEKVRYIHLNPVRRKLVECAGDWRWSSYQSWMSGCDLLVPLDRETLPDVIE